MAYTTIAKVKLRAQKALAPEVDPSLLDPILEEGIDYAEARVNSVLSQKYGVPFSPVPAAVSQIAADLAAAYALVETYSGGADNEPTLLADKLNARGEKWLMELASGEVSIPDSGGGAGTVCTDPTKPRIVTNKSSSGAIENFDLVNRPSGSSVPFANYKRWR